MRTIYSENQLIEIIDARIKQVLSEVSFVQKIPAVVVSVGTTYVDVRIAGDTVILSLPNKSNTTLKAGDSILLETFGGLSNAYISEKF